MKKPLFILFSFFTVTVSLVCQEITLSEGAPFYSDVEGHHGVGEGEGAVQVEAERAAKAAALDRIFSELGKDRMFQEMYISMWPEAIVVEESVGEERKDGSYYAEVRVRIDQQAVIITQPNYAENVQNILDRTEKILEEAEESVRAAQGHEENLRMAAAYTQFKQVETRLAELRLLLAPLGDSSLQSRNGNTKPALTQISSTLQSTVSSGIERLEKIERETEVSEATEEIRRTYTLLDQELEGIGGIVEKYGVQSPFYDIPKPELQAVLVELEQARELNGEIGEKLLTLKEGVPKDKLFLIEKIDLSYADTERLDAVLERLAGEVKLEIRAPRLVRQERARKWGQFTQGLASALVERTPRDIFVFRYYLPLGLDAGSRGDGFGFTGQFEFAAALEYYFADLVWFNTVLEKRDTLTGIDSKSIGFSQELNLGFGRLFLVGIGGGWDWGRWVRAAGVSDPAVRELYGNVFVGMIDREQNWPWGLLTLKVPFRFAPVLYLGRLNGGLEAMLRISTLFQLGGSLYSGFVQTDAAGSPESVRDDPGDYLEYQFQWMVTFGVRLPKPFLWGLRVEGGSSADISGNVVGDPGPLPLLWRLFIQYSL